MAALLVGCSSPATTGAPTETGAPVAITPKTATPVDPASGEQTTPTESATGQEATPIGGEVDRALLDRAMDTALTSGDGKVIGIDVETQYFEIDVLVGDQIREVKVSLDGTKVLKDENDTDFEDVQRAKSVKVTIGQALDTALPMGQGTFYEIALDNHRGRVVWEVEFIDNLRKHEILIDAVTGEVVK